MADEDDIPTVECVMVGAEASGKSCASIRFTTGKMPNYWQRTDVDNWSVRTVVNNKEVLLSIWDAWGQEESEPSRKIAGIKTDVVLMAFELSNFLSLKNHIGIWYEEIKNHIHGAPIVLVGMKKDITNDIRHRFRYKTLDKEVADAKKHLENLVQPSKPIAYYSCSSLLNDGISELFENFLKFPKYLRNCGQIPKTKC